jgi:hypothetical protein
VASPKRIQPLAEVAETRLDLPPYDRSHSSDPALGTTLEPDAGPSLGLARSHRGVPQFLRKPEKLAFLVLLPIFLNSTAEVLTYCASPEGRGLHQRSVPLAGPQVGSYLTSTDSNQPIRPSAS